MSRPIVTVGVIPESRGTESGNQFCTMPRERILKRLALVSGLGILGMLLIGSLLNEPHRVLRDAATVKVIGPTQKEEVHNQENRKPDTLLPTRPPRVPQSSLPMTSEPTAILGPKPSIPASERTLVLLLSYQRSGSSFIGDSLFNANPDSFFIYEPLDQVYAAMYGAAQGWTVPADITTNADGSLRIPPKEELDAVTWMMEVLLTCNMTAIPLEIYLHGFWRQQNYHMHSLQPFMKCMEAKRALGKLESCHNHLKKVCGRKFGEKGKKQDICLQRLWHHEGDNSVKMKPKEKQSFAAYDKCVEQYRTNVSKCVPDFKQACSSHSLHAMKTVRATMRSVEPLLEKYPNFKVIHLYRDPRAVVLSRKKASWARGRHDRLGELNKIAHVYCQTVMEDDKQRKILEKKYPGRLMKLEYGDFFHKPEAALDSVYQFLHLPVTSKKFIDVFRNRTQSKDSGKISTKWQREFEPQQIKTIEDECQTFAKQVDFSWH